MLELGQPNHPYDLAKVAGPGFRVRRGPGRRDAHHPRRRRAARSRRRTCSSATRDDDADRHRRDHGRRRQRDRRRHHRRAARDGLVPPDRHREVVASAQAPLRGAAPGSRRAATPRSSTSPCAGSPSCSARRSRTAPPSRPATLPERPPVRVRTARVARLLGTELSTDRIAEVLDPIGFTTTPAGDDLDVDIPSWRYDSEIRDRRHRGDRPPPRLHRARPHAPERGPRRVAVTAPGRAPPAPIAPRRARPHRGHADAVPRAR